MTRFSDSELYEDTLPERLAPLLQESKDFLQATQRLLGSDSRDAAEEKRFAQWHDTLLLHALEAMPSVRPICPQGVTDAFISGVLRACHYRDTVFSELPLIDTAGSRTLSTFEVDISNEEADLLWIRRALRRAFALSESDLAKFAQAIQPELDATSLRHRLMRALQELFPLSTEADNSDVTIRMFSAFFPDHPLRKGEVSIIRTGTNLFFCIPCSGHTLLTRKPEEGTAAERERITAFLSWLMKFQQRYYAHFPSFGPFRAEHASPSLLPALAKVSGLTADEIVQVLPTMVVILPEPEVDKYVVHDVWGHQWQALLFGFENNYQRVSAYQRFPDLTETFEGAHGTVDLGDVLVAAVRQYATSGKLSFDRWDRYLRVASAERLYHALSGLTAEVLADVVEYKFLLLNPDCQDLMPSSSLVKNRPTKLDLTLLDLPMYFGHALDGLRALSDDDATRSALAAAIQHRLPHTAPDVIETVVALFGDRTAEWLAHTCAIRMEHEQCPRGVHVNVFCRTVLNFVSLQAMFNTVYQRLVDQGERRDLPIRRFQDVMVFTVASYFERDWATNFWHLDEFLGHFESNLDALFTALADLAPPHPPSDPSPAPS